MATILSTGAVPRCTECLRNHAFGLFPTARHTLRSIQQVRGKKKKSTRGPVTLPVRLLQDVKSFGREGSLVPVPHGRMRNQWFPKGIAEYVTFAELRTIRLGNITVERDVGFGMPQEELENEAVEAVKTIRAVAATETEEFDAEPEVPVAPPPKLIEVERIPPARSIELVDIFVPNRLDFYRQLIHETPETPKAQKELPERKNQKKYNAADDLLAVRAEAAADAVAGVRKQDPSIYGSVSTGDVLVAVRAVMANNDEAARVILEEDDIKFIKGETEKVDDPTRVKQIGLFTVEIRVKGADKVVKRTVRVNAQSSS